MQRNGLQILIYATFFFILKQCYVPKLYKAKMLGSTYEQSQPHFFINMYQISFSFQLFQSL